VKVGLYDKVKMEATFWLARRLPECTELVQVMSQSLERDLTLRERAVLRLHYLYCGYCLSYLKSLRFMRDAAREKAGRVEAGEAPPGPGLSPEARDRIRRALER
jgi:hypothetical protein